MAPKTQYCSDGCRLCDRCRSHIKEKDTKIRLLSWAMREAMENHKITCDDPTICSCWRQILGAAMQGKLPDFLLTKEPDLPAKFGPGAFGGYQVTELMS